MTDSKQLEALALEMTGESSDPLAAFDQWRNERAALAEVWDELQALEMINRRMNVCLDLARSTVDAVESDCGMFITDKTRKKITLFREQLEKITQARAHGKQITQRESRPVTVISFDSGQ
jgi:hypothetical protein